MKRSLIVVALLSLGLGAYFGSARIADSTSSRPRVVTLRNHGIAVYGNVQCVADSSPISRRHMECSRRPGSRAPYNVEIYPNLVVVTEAGSDPDDPPLFMAP